MAVRYSGETVIRLRWDRRTRTYAGTVTDPRLVYRGRVAEGHTLLPRDPTSSKAYDDAARRLLKKAQGRAQAKKKAFAVEAKHGQIFVRRLFESPCPT